MHSHHCIFSNTFVGMGGIPSAIIDIGSFNNFNDSFGPSEGSSESNVGIPLVLRRGSIESMGILDIFVGGPESNISSEQLVIDVNRYYKSFLSYGAVLYTIEYLAICG